MGREPEDESGKAKQRISYAVQSEAKLGQATSILTVETGIYIIYNIC